MLGAEVDQWQDQQQRQDQQQDQKRGKHFLNLIKLNFALNNSVSHYCDKDVTALVVLCL